MNNVNLIGRVAMNPKQGNGVVSSLLAVKRIYKSNDGVEADFIPLTLFGKQADNFNRLTKKGDKVGIDGRIKTSTYTNEQGNTEHGWTVVVSHFYLLSVSRKGNDHSSQAKVDKQLDNLDTVLDHAQTQTKKQHKPMPVLSGSDPRLIARFDMSDDGNDSGSAHESSNDFSQEVKSAQPTIEELEAEIKELKSRELPF